MVRYLYKTFTASQPLDDYNDLRLRLVVYGNAYMEIARLSNYSVFNIEETFINNERGFFRTLQVRLTLEEIDITKVGLKEIN